MKPGVHSFLAFFEGPWSGPCSSFLFGAKNDVILGCAIFQWGEGCEVQRWSTEKCLIPDSGRAKCWDEGLAS